MSSKETVRTVSQPADSLVWDPLVRIGHWALVAAFAVAYFSAEEGSGGPGGWHVWSCYLVGGIVVLRVLWGFVGSRHARFSDFIYGPVKTLTYLRDLLLGRGRRYLGHSPAGGAMVIALLACLAATVATGIVVYGEQGKGPLAASPVTDTTSAIGNGTEHPVQPEAKGERTESVISEVHDLLANITVALVVGHILGVALASLVHRENLVLAMISGRKRRARD